MLHIATGMHTLTVLQIATATKGHSMKKMAIRDKQVDVFQKADVESLVENGVFELAAHHWHTDWENDGAPTHGTCVVGNGLAVWYCAPRKRSPRRLIVVRPPHNATGCEPHYEDALAWLKEELGTDDVDYWCGRMD